MIPRNFLLLNGLIRQSIWKSWALSPVGNKIFIHENVLQLIKNGNIISKQKIMADTWTKGELRCTSRLLNAVTTNSIIDQKAVKIMLKTSEKREDVIETKNENQMLSNCDKCILLEPKIPEKPKPPTHRLFPAASNSNKILRRPDFEIEAHLKKMNGKPTQTLIVFSSKDNAYEKLRCRTLFYDITQKRFICGRCRSRGKYVCAKLIANEDEKFIELSKNDHICEPKLYEDVKSRLNPDYIEKPNYEIRYDGTSQNLIVFTNIEQSLGHEFYYDVLKDNYVCKACDRFHNKTVCAKLMEIDGKDVIRMFKHFCEPISLQKPIVVKEADCVKLKKNQLFIFSSMNSNMGYKYFYSKTDDLYYCCECDSKDRNITAKPVQDENNEKCLRLSKNEHICKPIQYQCDASEIKQPDLIWPKENEGNEALENFMKQMLRIHPHGTNVLKVFTYVITNAPPESSAERKASCILYVGYSEDYKRRLTEHMCVDGTVKDLVKKYGDIYTIPIFEDIPSACYDLEAIIIELRRRGSLNFHLFNSKKGFWTSNTEAGGFRIIAENPDHPGHFDFVLAIKKLLVTRISTAVPFKISFLETKSRSPS